MSESALIAHVDSTYRSRAELALIPTPEGTKTWRPVGHYALVDSVTAELERRDITIVRERFAVSHNDARLFGVMDLRVNGFNRPDVGMALGLRGANDKTMRTDRLAPPCHQPLPPLNGSPGFLFTF
jgi:hypothetical protein